MWTDLQYPVSCLIYSDEPKFLSNTGARIFEPAKYVRFYGPTLWNFQ